MKRRISPADRLIRIVVRRRGAATLREIARTHLTGTDFEEAKRETAGLVVFEPTYQNSRRKRSQTARLTQKGVWQAIRLTRGYDPTLVASVLAATDIKTILDRLEAERNPLAVEIASFRADAMEYRRQLAARKTAKNEYEKALLVAPKRKRSARHYERLARFLESKKQPAFGLRVPDVTTKTREIPLGTRESTAPINPRPALPTLTGFRCRECDRDTAEHMIGCPRFGQREGAFAIGKPKTLAQDPLLVKQLRENAEAKRAALSTNCMICQADKMLNQKTPHDCAAYQSA